MARNDLVIRVRITGVRETLRAFRRLPPEANRELRERTLQLSQSIATSIRAAAVADSPQSALMAPTVRARKDRVPAVQAGGSRRVGRNRKPAHKILFGSEFGSNHLKQFRPHLGQGSYWFFRTVERQQAEVDRTWNQIADDIVRRFSDEGGVR